MDVFTLTDIKRKNLSDIYHYIYSNPGCSKQNIANALSISLPTVSQHLSTLLNAKLIEKCGRLTSTVGRRAVAYQIISTARIAVGIEIMDKNIYIAALNLYGKKEVKEKYKIEFHPDQTYFESLQKIVKDFISQNGFDESQILGIGLGIQGLTSPDGSEVTYGKILNCTGLKIELFSDYFSVPCKFMHDSECASNSELWENPEVNDALYLFLSQHLGGAIFVNGELQNGKSGKSATFEHMTLIPDGKQCYCGSRGCAECYCSGTFLTDSDMELEEFFERKNQGDPDCQRKWQEFLQYLSMLINNLHTVVESTIILGGHITPYFTDEDVDFIKQTVSKRSAFDDDVSYILLGRCRNDAVTIGAALPFIKDFISSLAI